MKKMKKIALLFLCLILMMSPMTVFAEESTTANEATIITIIHTNDTHARVSEGAYDGMGFPRIASIIKEAKTQNPNVLVIDAGDAFHGTTFATLVEGESIVKLMNDIGYDVMVPGNHDFNYGQDQLIALRDLANFDIISANIKKSDNTDYIAPYVIKEVDDVKIAIFGLTTPETSYKTHPDNVEGLEFIDPIEVAEDMVAELEGEADIVIALAHLGNDQETEITSRLVAEQVEGLDLIIDGHSHSVYEEGLSVGDTLIVSAGEYDKNLGFVDIEVQDDDITFSARLVTKEDASAYEEDADLLATIESIKAEQEEVLSEGIGSTLVKLDGERADVRTKETNLGNLITDAMIALTDADAAITNGGGIRASIEVGEITKGDVITVLPFGNYIVTKHLTGVDIKAALEHGLSAYPESAGSFSQVSGITYTIDLNRDPADRVINIQVGEQPLELDKEYVVATNDFMAAGGDNYTMFADKETVNEYMALDEALIEYIVAQEVVDITVDGRMSVIELVVTEPVREEPAPEPAPVQDSVQQTYVVVSGDVLWKIAEKFGVTWQELAKVNNMENAHLIFPGQEILVP